MCVLLPIGIILVNSCNSGDKCNCQDNKCFFAVMHTAFVLQDAVKSIRESGRKAYVAFLDVKKHLTLFGTKGYLWRCIQVVFYTSSTTGTPLPLVQYYYVVTTLDHSPSCREFTRVQFYLHCCTTFTWMNSSTPLNAQGFGSRLGMLSAELPCMQMTWHLWLAPQKNFNKCWTLSRITHPSGNTNWTPPNLLYFCLVSLLALEL